MVCAVLSLIVRSVYCRKYWSHFMWHDNSNSINKIAEFCTQTWCNCVIHFPKARSPNMQLKIVTPYTGSENKMLAKFYFDASHEWLNVTFWSHTTSGALMISLCEFVWLFVVLFCCWCFFLMEWVSKEFIVLCLPSDISTPNSMCNSTMSMAKVNNIHKSHLFRMCQQAWIQAKNENYF